jgi:hypothetical protein
METQPLMSKDVRNLVKATEGKSKQFTAPLQQVPTKETKTNSVALVRERTIPTERPPLVGEVSANFFG